MRYEQPSHAVAEEKVKSSRSPDSPFADSGEQIRGKQILCARSGHRPSGLVSGKIGCVFSWFMRVFLSIAVAGRAASAAR